MPWLRLGTVEFRAAKLTQLRPTEAALKLRSSKLACGPTRLEGSIVYFLHADSMTAFHLVSEASRTELKNTFLVETLPGGAVQYLSMFNSTSTTYEILNRSCDETNVHRLKFDLLEIQSSNLTCVFYTAQMFKNEPTA